MVGPVAWLVGSGCAVVLVGLLARGLVRAERHSLGPADVVTLGRGLMACAVAALTVEVLDGQDVTGPLVGLAAPALALDAVDGWVARRTGTVSALGGRFDGEVDAFLILVLSVAVAPMLGWWVLAGGLARYAFGAAGWVLPWLRGRLDFRYWRKVVTAVTGVVLVVAVADVLPAWLTVTGVVGAHVLLAESFGRDVWTLWTRRGARPAPTPTRPSKAIAAVGLLTGLVLLWFVLVAPNEAARITPGSFVRLPVEPVVAGALVLVAPERVRQVLVTLACLVVCSVAALKVLDLGAFAVLDRPFNLVTDRGLPGSGLAFVLDSFGPWGAAGSVGAVLVFAAAIGLGLPWVVTRCAALLAGARRQSAWVVAGLGAAWVLSALTGLQLGSGAPVALSGTVPYLAGKARATVTAYEDREWFDRALTVDAHGSPAPGELAGLKGKDVVVIFVESYGRVAIEGDESRSVRSLVDSATAELGALGVTARSGWLTSTTFGGSSWLAHATVQSGLPVTDQPRYDRLLSAGRTTLASAFSREGWRTVAVMPSTHGDWPEGQAFYGFDEVYTGSELRYAGPRFGFSAVPDQFALASFAELELGPGRSAPVMAMAELTSSHGPWAPVPTMLDPEVLGDGTVYDAVQANATTAGDLWRDRSAVPTAYRDSIAYSLRSVLSFVERQGDDLVVVLLGDHQPSTIVSGTGGNRDVPVSVIARDPSVVDRISSWGWRAGLRPDPGSPVWPMADFRDQFLGAYSDGPARP